MPDCILQRNKLIGAAHSIKRKNLHHFCWVVLLIVLVLGSCGEKEIPVPLTQEQMIEVLIDLHLAESMLDKLPLVDQDTVGHVYYRMIFREHDVTEADFDQSMSILREDPERLNAIYIQVLEKLGVLDATERGAEEMAE